MEIVERRKLHVIAKLATEVSICVSGHGNCQTIELCRGEGEGFLWENRVVVWDAWAVVEEFRGPEFGNRAQHWEDETLIELADAAHLGDKLLGRVVGIVHHLIYSPESAIGNPKQGERHLFVREDVDENALELEDAVVVVGLF